MTTIAYKDGVVAFDSRITSGMTINYDDFDKSREVNGVIFFLSGYTCDYQKLVDAWFGEPVKGSVEASALAFDGESLWYVSYGETDGLCRSPLSLASPYVIGSGSPHAQTAMDMGCTAAQAVKMAMKRDAGTGGKVRTFKLPR
jgi:ATP-dependent protease HslVU (ClpYQ) peptidase subunit